MKAFVGIRFWWRWHNSLGVLGKGLVFTIYMGHFVIFHVQIRIDRKQKYKKLCVLAEISCSCCGVLGGYRCWCWEEVLLTMYSRYLHSRLKKSHEVCRNYYLLRGRNCLGIFEYVLLHAINPVSVTSQISWWSNFFEAPWTNCHKFPIFQRAS